MKKIIKALIFVVLLGITIITSVVRISKFEASELNVDEIYKCQVKYPQFCSFNYPQFVKA